MAVWGTPGGYVTDWTTNGNLRNDRQRYEIWAKGGELPRHKARKSLCAPRPKLVMWCFLPLFWRLLGQASLLVWAINSLPLPCSQLHRSYRLLAVQECSKMIISVKSLQLDGSNAQIKLMWLEQSTFPNKYTHNSKPWVILNGKRNLAMR